MAAAQSNSPGVPTVNSYLQMVSGAYDIFADLQRGGSVNDAAAALTGTSLAAKTGTFGSSSSAISGAAGDAADALGIYSGIEQGGVAGDSLAAIDATRLTAAIGGQTGALSAGVAGGIGEAASVAGIGLDLYNEIEGWQSGATGADALAGAETGAAAGGVIAGAEAGSAAGSVVPVIGTAIGAVVGAAVGALSSLIGGGKTDPETTSLQNVTQAYSAAYAESPQGAQSALAQMSPSQSFQLLAGAFDAKTNTPGHSQALEQTLGRMQEGTFLSDMAGQINQAFTSGQYTMTAGGGLSVKTGGGTVTYPPSAAAQTIMASTVTPWINSITNNEGIQGAANGEGGVLTGAVQNLVSSYITGGLTSSTPIGISGQASSKLPTFAGTIQAAAGQVTTPPVVANVNKVVSSFPVDFAEYAR